MSSLSMRTAISHTSLSHCVIATLMAVSAVSGCALNDRFPKVPPPVLPADEVDIAHRVILLGDAGHAEAGDEVLNTLTSVLTEFPGVPKTVVFLGDNIYPSGLPDPRDPQYQTMRDRLDQQLNAGGVGDANVRMVPGNHDWGSGAEAGVRRQAAYIDAANTVPGSAQLALLPAGHCAGPTFEDLRHATDPTRASARLIMLDSEWMLRGERSPCRNNDAAAGPDSNRSIQATLDNTITSAPTDLVIIAVHHPLRTRGPHGGFFSWKQHLFPLTNVSDWHDSPWSYALPLPVVPTLLYIAPRWLGVTKQDLSNRRYRKFINTIESVITRSGNRRIVVAAGHEHSIQMIEDGGALHLVSGAGSYGHHTPVARGATTRMATPHSGFLIFDIRTSPHDDVVIELVEVIKDPGIRAGARERRDYRAVW